MSQGKVCVIGAGVIGLSSAVRIQSAIPNVEVTIIADTFSPNTTSDGAAGIWGPHLVNPAQKEWIRKWGQGTFDHVMKLMKSEEGGKLGAQLLSGYNFASEVTSEDPFWKDQVLAYRKLDEKEKDIHPNKRDGVFYTTLLIDVKSYLPWLMEKFRSNGGKVQFRTISSFSEISDDFDVIVNCVGLRARQLLNDEEINPARGQVMRVYAPWIKHFYIDIDEDGDGTEAYIIPGRDYVVLGGTGQEGNWNTEVDQKDKDRIWEECVKLVPSLKSARKVNDWVGLRPKRSTIRLETENIKGNKNVVIVHNYGHGGAGVTLHWGCAGEATELVNTALEKLSLTSLL